MHNAPPIAALGKRTLVVAEYDSFTVSETGDEIMNRLADALGGELYPNQLHRP